LKTNQNIKLILLLLLFCGFVSCNDYTLSESQSERFLHYYPVGTGESVGYDVLQANDGGYYIIGTVEQEGSNDGSRDIMLIKTDKFGIQESWSPAITGTPGDDVISRMIFSGSDLVLAGKSTLDGETSGYCVKMSGSGQIIWEILFSEESQIEINDVYPVYSNFVLTGYSRSAGQDKQVLLAMINQNGNEIWTRNIGLLNHNDEGQAIIKYNDRLLVAATSAPVNLSVPSQILVLNTNLSGLGATEQRVSYNHPLFAKELIVDNEDNITILGNQVNSETDKSGLFLIEFFLQGTSHEVITILSSETIIYKESLHGESLIISDNNRLAVCGWQIRDNDMDILLAFINDDLSLKGINSFGNAGNQISYGIMQANDGRYLLTGSSVLAGINTSTLLKIEADGQLY